MKKERKYYRKYNKGHVKCKHIWDVLNENTMVCDICDKHRKITPIELSLP